jgi:hypothetical protein
MVALPVWVTLIALAAGMLIGGMLAKWAFHRQPDLTIDNALKRMPLPFALAAMPAALFLALYLQNDVLLAALFKLPVTLGYWAIGLAWDYFAAVTAFLGAFVVMLAHRAQHVQRNQVVLACSLLLVAVLVPQWTFTRPVADKLTHDVDRDGAVYQTSGVSCAAASGANIARTLGLIDVSEAATARAMGTTQLGTTMPQAVVGMKALGISCTPLSAPADPIRIETPAFLFIDHPSVGRNGHAIALLRRSGDNRYVVIDPLSGRQSWTREQLDKVWHGFAVSCRK